MNTKKKRTPNQKKKAIVSVLLMVAILITGAFAFLSATDSKTNVFTVGNVKIKLSEEFDTNQNGSIEKTNDENDEVYDASETQVSLKGEILPGQEIIKRPYIENTGKNKAWVYVTVGIPTAQDVDIISKDGKTNLTGTEQKILIQAYAIQENYKNNNTYESTWNAYFEGKEESVFGPKLTENIGTHIPIFTILNSNNKINTPNAGWKQIGEVYRSTNGYNYYVFGYETLLEAKENDSANWTKTEFCFEKVKLLSDIGENELTTLDYLIKETEKDTLQAEVALNELANVPEGYILLKREYYIPGEKVSSLYFDDNLAKNGYSFDWSYLDNPSKKAYAGMEITKPTELVASYVNRADTDNPTTSTKISDWLTYNILYNKAEKLLYASLIGANADHPNYPNGSTTETVVIPAMISAKWMGDTFEITDGTYKETELGTTDLYIPDTELVVGKTYSLPVKKISDGYNSIEAMNLKAVAKSVVMGDTIEYIGNLFKNSTILTDIVLPYHTTDSNSSFYNCTALKKVYIPSSFTKIGFEMFGRCTGLTELNISEGVQEIGVDSFIRCTNLTKIVTPSTLTTIRNGAFAMCSSVNDFTWGENIEELGYYCVWKWTKGVTIRIKSIDSYCNVKTVWLSSANGDGAEGAAQWGVDGYTSFNSPQYFATTYLDGQEKEINGDISLSEGVTSVCDYAFSDSKIKSITFPNTLKYIGVDAFRNTSILKVDFPSSVEEIGSQSFMDTKIAEVIFPESVKSVGEKAFRHCPITKVSINSDIEYPNIGYLGEVFGGPYDSSIQYIALGKAVTSLNISASGLGQLKEIAVDKNNQVLASEDGVLYNKEKTVLIKYPNKKQGTLNIPNSVTTIGDRAFSGCSSLTNLIIPDNVNSIGVSCFSNCMNLKSITIPHSITTISKRAFEKCSKLTSITISDGATHIEDFAFSDCTSLTDVVIPDSVTNIGQGTFKNCKNLVDITIPNSVTSIDAEAFECCYKLTNIKMSENIINIGDYAFSICLKIKSITIPNSVTSIGRGAFEYCDALQEIIYQGTMKDWNKVNISDEAFGNIKTITCTDGTVTTQ